MASFVRHTCTMSVMAWVEGILVANPPVGAAVLAAVLSAPSLLHTLALGLWFDTDSVVERGPHGSLGAFLSNLRWMALGALMGCISTVALVYWLVRREGIFHVSWASPWTALCVLVIVCTCCNVPYNVRVRTTFECMRALLTMDTTPARIHTRRPHADRLSRRHRARALGLGDRAAANGRGPPRAITDGGGRKSCAC